MMIIMIDLRKINLNLLLALDALLSECHVTRASKKLFITQSAMSNSLNQLRELFNDELLVRGPKGMLPTPLAIKLKPKLKQLLESMNTFFAHENEFNPATSTRTFHIGMSDHAEFLLLPKLLTMLTIQAPHVEVSIQHLNSVVNDHRFTTQDLELGVGCMVQNTSNLYTTPLFNIRGQVIARKDHPLMQKRLTLKRYLNAKHLRITYHKNQLRITSNVEMALAEMGKARDIQATLRHVLPALFCLQDSDLIATIPNLLTPDLAERLHLALQPLPFKIHSCQTFLAWHNSTDQDPGLQWLRSEILKAAETA